MTYFYIVSQTWIDKNGGEGSRNFLYFEAEGLLPAVNRALNKYHEILGYGATAPDQYHAAILLRSDGAVVKPYEYYDRIPEPEPTPEPEPEPDPKPEPEPEEESVEEPEEEPVSEGE